MKIYNVEAEKNVLGCLLMEEKIAYCVESLSEDHFMQPMAREILSAMKRLYAKGKPLDMVQVSSIYPKADILQMTDWVNFCMPFSFQSSIDILEECRKRREMRELARKVIEEIECEDIAVDEIKSATLTKIQATFQGQSLSDSPYERVSRTWEKIISAQTSERKRWNTGLVDFDRLTGGLYPGDFTNIAAGSGVGKTAFALQVARNLTRNGLKGLFVSREMSEDRIDYRLIASLTGIDTRKIRNAQLTQKEMEEIQWVLFQDLANRNLIVNDDIGTVSQIKNRLRRESFDFVVVDYIQLMDPETRGENREQQVASISRRLKILTREFNVAVIALTQVNVDGEARESRAIFFDSDNYLKIRRLKDGEWEKIVRRHEHIPRDFIKGVQAVGNDIVMFELEKQRDGGIGSFPALHIKNRLEYRSIEKEEYMLIGMDDPMGGEENEKSAGAEKTGKGAGKNPEGRQ